MTTFNDIFKSSFLEKVSSFSLLDMGSPCCFPSCRLFIFAVYRKTFSGVMYSASFGASLVAMALVTTLIILAVTSNVILSLGMVGALSIVRFRTASRSRWTSPSSSGRSRRASSPARAYFPSRCSAPSSSASSSSSSSIKRAPTTPTSSS